MPANNKLGLKSKKLKCDYCTRSILVDEITDGWVRVTGRNGKVVLTGCPEHSTMVINVINEINGNDVCKCGHTRRKHGKIKRMCFVPGCKCLVFRV